MPFLYASDVISGQEGWISFRITHKDPVTGQMLQEVEQGAYVRTLTATIEKNKEEIYTLGHRGAQYKTTGWTGSGSMNVYYITSKFRQLMNDYTSKGIDFYFDTTVWNNDPTSTIGVQELTLQRCNFDSTVLARLDVENTTLDEDLDFTFEDFYISQAFVSPTLNTNNPIPGPSPAP